MNHNFPFMASVITTQRPRQGKDIMWGIDIMELAFI